MEILKEIFYLLWQHDFEKLSNPNMLWYINLLIFIIIFLENGLLPATFLPGDSLLILIGVLISKGVFNFSLIIMLTIAASLGSWISYLQGKWLSDNKLVKIWISNLPIQYHQRACQMFYRYGFYALFISRFIAFIRTLLPIIAGLSNLNIIRFQIFNWLSSLLWILILTLIGFTISKTFFFQNYEEELMLLLVLLPLFLLIIGIFSYLIFLWNKIK